MTLRKLVFSVGVTTKKCYEIQGFLLDMLDIAGHEPKCVENMFLTHEQNNKYLFSGTWRGAGGLEQIQLRSFVRSN